MNTQILSQGLDALPGSFLKNTAILLLGSLVGLGALGSWLAYYKRKERSETIRADRPAVTRAPTVRKDICDFKMGEVTRRLDEHAADIADLRDADQRLSERLDNSFQTVRHALGRIEGKLDSMKDK